MLVQDIDVQLAVVLGKTQMPIHQLLRMGRGAVIELDSTEKDEVTVLANNIPIAKAGVVIRGDRIAIEIARMLPR